MGFGYGPDEIAKTGMLADGDGVADIQLAADGNHGVGVEAAVGAHDKLSRGSGVAHSAHRLPQEVVRAPSGVGPALALPCHQHVAGGRSYGQQRVIAPLTGVTMATGALLAQTVGLADGGVQVDGQRLIAQASTGGPGPSQQLPAHPIQLTDMTPPEAAQKGPQGGRRFHRTPQHPCGAAGAQHVGAIDAVTTGQRQRHQRQQLVSSIGPTRRISQVNVAVLQLTQTQVLGQCNRQEQSGIGHQAVIIEGDMDAVG